MGLHRPTFVCMKQSCLFVGIHNAARSQMAEAFLNAALPARFEAHSAGLEPGPLNPLAVEAMREVGLDISRNESKAVVRSEEHTSELQSPCNLVCRLLLEKKKKQHSEE